MSVKSSEFGLQGEQVVEVVEDRWLTNYAAAVVDPNEVYYDNRFESPAVHPAYISHLEWKAIASLHEQMSMTVDERLRGVHSWNHTQLEGTFAAGATLRSVSELVGIEESRSGTKLTINTKSFSGANRVAESLTQTVYRDVDLVGEPVVPKLPEQPKVVAPNRNSSHFRQEAISISSFAPYHFSECARDYGPIHTDLKLATAAGIDGLILHGTATFAYMLSSVVNTECDGEPNRVANFGGLLRGMIFCPSEIRLESERVEDVVLIRILDDRAAKCVFSGFVSLRTDI